MALFFVIILLPCDILNFARTFFFKRNIKQNTELFGNKIKKNLIAHSSESENVNLQKEAKCFGCAAKVVDKSLFDKVVIFVKGVIQ